MGTKLYVGSLPYSTTEQELQELFAQRGSVQSAKVITDRFTGQSRGFGFVEMATAEDAQQAILGHAAYTGVARTTPMARALFAVDELCGFLVACALVRPSRSLADLEVGSVKKKLKDKAFARGVSRDDVHTGAAELGVPLDDVISMVLAALRPHERVLGLGAP